MYQTDVEDIEDDEFLCVFKGVGPVETYVYVEPAAETGKYVEEFRDGVCVLGCGRRGGGDVCGEK